MSAPHASHGSSAGAEPTVLLDSVTIFYGEVVGLSGVSLNVGPGITGLVGPNGSGKSTLMRVLSGCIPTAEGTARIFAQDPFTDASARNRVAIVPTPECFSPHLSGRQNVELACLARGLPPRDARDRAAHALNLAGLEEDANRTYGAWSRGMRQRLKVGLALAHEAELVLLDEPHLGVDPPNRRRLSELVQQLADKRCTILLASHVLSEVETLTQQIVVLMYGRLLGHGSITQLLEQLRDRHPHRIRVVAQDARRLAAALIVYPHVQQVRLLADETLEFITDRPDQACLDLAQTIAKTGSIAREISSDDDSLEAVFRSLTAAGAAHLREVT